MQDTTAPTVVRDLAAKVALIEQYQPSPEWAYRHESGAAGTWVLRWDRLTLAGDLDDLELARFIAAERTRARQALRRIVVEAVDALALTPRRKFLHPATPGVNAGLTRCPACGCHVIPSGHRPGSGDCHADREERNASRYDE